jgi:hypothetical protein
LVGHTSGLEKKQNARKSLVKKNLREIDHLVDKGVNEKEILKKDLKVTGCENDGLSSLR